MITVVLYRDEGGVKTKAGTLDFFGVAVAAADGLVWLEFHGGECGSHAQVRLCPAGVATAAEVAAVGQALCRNEVEGRVGRFDWRGK
jgi:hypothetical protein